MMSIIVWLLVMVWIGVWLPLVWNIAQSLHPEKAEAPAPFAYRFDVTDDDLLDSARLLTAEWDKRDASGEYKRHQVLSALIDAFPNRSKRDMARAIEAALWL